MATTVEAAPPPPPALREEARRLEQLRVMRRRATGMLVVVTTIFVVVTLAGHGRGWLGWVQAAAEASMVGGLADWFAVTAIFRHPLGIPIPHTAVIPERKEQFGETLGRFVQENFLTPETITERVRSSHVTERASAWLAERRNAEVVAEYVADAAVGLADLVRDEEVQALVQGEIERRVEALPVARFAGRALRMMTADHRHEELFDAVLRGLTRVLDEHEADLRDRFGQQAPWWLPGAVEDRVFDRLLEGLRNLMREINTDPDHEVRAEFTTWVDGLADRLESSDEFRERGDKFKHDLLAHPELREWSQSVWGDLKAALRTQAEDPRSELRSRVADAVEAAAKRLHDDSALTAKIERVAEGGVRYVAEHFHDEIGDLVSTTISRWDADETSRRLEILLGPDLQFIRINGTVVGGLAGVAIHALARALA